MCGMYLFPGTYTFSLDLECRYGGSRAVHTGVYGTQTRVQRLLLSVIPLRQALLFGSNRGAGCRPCRLLFHLADIAPEHLCFNIDVNLNFNFNFNRGFSTCFFSRPLSCRRSCCTELCTGWSCRSACTTSPSSWTTPTGRRW